VHHPVVALDGQPIIVFVTACTAGRKPILTSSAASELILDAWRAADHWLVGRYVILPDHVHLFCAPHGEVPLAYWVRFWRVLVSRRWPRPQDQPIWQRSFWDTQLRRGDRYEAKWEYVRNNPVRHGLVAQARDWPYAGELNVLPWD
jgi:REP element-mobilizing transposase RayT